MEMRDTRACLELSPRGLDRCSVFLRVPLRAYPLGECMRDALASVIELALGPAAEKRKEILRLA